MYLNTFASADPDAVVGKHYDFMIFFDCAMGAVNGNSGGGSGQRYNIYDGHAYCTDAALKYKIRREVELLTGEDKGHRIFLHSETLLNKDATREKKYIAPELVPGAKEVPVTAGTVKEFLCQNFYDVRTFGSVVTKSTRAGIYASLPIKGPVQLGMAQTVSRIPPPRGIALTRCVTTTQAEFEKNGMRTMGNRSPIMEYGLFCCKGSVNAAYAKDTGFSIADLDLFFKAAANMFQHDKSATRAECSVRKVIAFEHESEYGNAPAWKLHDLVRISKADGRPLDSVADSFDDYRMEIDSANVPNRVRILEIA